jgi:hypothetical protein
LIPVLTAFAQRHDVCDIVVVADAGMLSAANLNALEDAGFNFIVGSRITKAPYDLAEHFERHGTYFTDGQVLESARRMGTGKAARARRVVYQWKFKREQHDNKAINAMIDRAEKIADGRAPLKKARFLKITDITTELDQVTIDRARQLAGLKGYVTNLPASAMDGAAVIAAYHDLWKVEQSFRMTKTDLRARPVFHHQREAIEAHLTVVFAALAVALILKPRKIVLKGALRASLCDPCGTLDHESCRGFSGAYRRNGQELAIPRERQALPERTYVRKKLRDIHIERAAARCREEHQRTARQEHISSKAHENADASFRKPVPCFLTNCACKIESRSNGEQVFDSRL